MISNTSGVVLAVGVYYTVSIILFQPIKYRNRPSTAFSVFCEYNEIYSVPSGSLAAEIWVSESAWALTYLFYTL